jgi:hypothetical protein
VSVGHTPSHSSPDLLNFLSTKTTRISPDNAFRGTSLVETNAFYIDDKIDIYSFGILMAEVAARGLNYSDGGVEGNNSGETCIFFIKKISSV